jgi:uncharacterized C2H2 Zn-finger protein
VFEKQEQYDDYCDGCIETYACKRCGATFDNWEDWINHSNKTSAWNMRSYYLQEGIIGWVLKKDYSYSGSLIRICRRIWISKMAPELIEEYHRVTIKYNKDTNGTSI